MTNPSSKKSTSTADRMVKAECQTESPNLRTGSGWPGVPTRQVAPLPSGSMATVCCCCSRRAPAHVMQYAVAATVTSAHVTTTKAGSSRAHWFFVCLWYAVCRYLHGAAAGSPRWEPRGPTEAAPEVATRIVVLPAPRAGKLPQGLHTRSTRSREAASGSTIEPSLLSSCWTGGASAREEDSRCLGRRAELHHHPERVPASSARASATGTASRTRCGRPGSLAPTSEGSVPHSRSHCRGLRMRLK